MLYLNGEYIQIDPLGYTILNIGAVPQKSARFKFVNG